MLTLSFNQISNKLDVKIVNQYLDIMNNVNPENPKFQESFSDFYQINNSGWKSPAIMKSLFFNVFSAFNEINKKGYQLNYEMIVTMLSKISGMTEKSFSSKMLHTLCKDEPIIDSKVIGKIQDKKSNFKLATGYAQSLYAANYTLPMAIDLHDCLKKYYGILKKDASTILYISEFDNWCKGKGINSKLISDTKKIDFWMWLA